MAKISLRAYNHEIENLIDRGQTEEGISHCKYILKTYPKHLDTYRLLGKAFLESQRYSEAADILQRILSVQPDDFVSQIGMSIIREDEGNLDAAIYHMERAFEIQPANVAIQDELRRLYGRRDGVEPSKLRMTRGALVRMYARGDLYRQAIAEVRAALKEDPQRLDLEIVLARMYFQTGLKAEAAEISSRLVGKLPYCYEANRILAEVLPETSRAEEAKTYKQKLVALDPYLAYLSETVFDPRQVQENAVSLDRLDWTPSLEGSQQPTWANSLGIQLNDTENEKMPQWMITVPSSDSTPEPSADVQDTAQPFIEEPALFENQMDAIAPQDEDLQIQSQENDLPDWMKSSGWGISQQPAQEQIETFSESEVLAAEPANIPDWLKEIAPESGITNIESETSQNADWVNSILPVESIQEDQTDQIQLQEPTSEVAPNFAETINISPVNEDLPDWFKTTMPAMDESMNTNQSNEPLPDWLSETPRIHPENTISDEISGTIGLPVTTEEPEELALPVVESELEIEQAETQVPQPSSQVQDGAPEGIGETIPDLSNADAAMAWLESLAAKNGAEEETLLTRPEERNDTPPEWVSQVASEPTAPDTFEPARTLIDEGLLAGAASLTSETSVPAEDVTAQIDDLPQPVAQNFEELSEPQAVISTEPESLADIGEIKAPVDQALPSETADMDAAFSWLESLAAKQGAEAESLLSDASERQVVPPDWVTAQADEAAVLDETSSISNSDQLVENLSETTLPSIEMPQANEEPQPDEQVLPEWLNNIDSSSEQPYTHEEERTVVAETLPVAGEWVHEQDTEESRIVLDQDESKTQTSELSSQEVSGDVDQPVTFGNTRPLPSWLVSSPGSAQDKVEQVNQPESVEDLPLPDWLKDENEPVSEQPAVTPGNPIDENTPELPDWLKDLETEQDEETIPVSSLSSQIPEPQPVIVSNIPSEMLTQAQETLAKGQIELSMSIYGQLIQQGQHIEETIHDLRDALYRFPVESEIWQTLGDANFRNNHVQEALDAYTKAEELLK